MSSPQIDSESRQLRSGCSDARLRELVWAGDARAFEALVARYKSPLERYCQRLGLIPTQAEDAAQHAFLQCWLAAQADKQIEQLPAWLYRTAHNAAIDILRRPEPQPLAAADDKAGSEESFDVDVERRTAARAALGGLADLPDRQRQAMLQTAIHGYSYDQVARNLGVSQGAVAQLVHRARARLRVAVGAILAPLPVGFTRRFGIFPSDSAPPPGSVSGTLYIKAAIVLGASAVVAAPVIVDRANPGRPPRRPVAVSQAHVPQPHRTQPAVAVRAQSRPARHAVARVTPAAGVASPRYGSSDAARERAKARLDTRKQAIDAKKQSIDAQKNALDARKEHASPAQQAALDARKDALDRKKDALDHRKDLLDARKNRIDNGPAPPGG